MIRLNKKKLINPFFLRIFLLIPLSTAFAAQKDVCPKDTPFVPPFVKTILSGPFTCPFFRANILSQVAKQSPDQLKSTYYYLKRQLAKLLQISHALQILLLQNI